VAWNMAEKAEFASLLRSSWGDAIVLAATFLLTVFEDLTVGIGAGVTLSAFLFLHRMAESVEVRAGVATLDDQADATGEARTPYDPRAGNGGILVYRISGAFFFGASTAVSSVLERIGERPKVFVLDFADVPLIDSSGARALEAFVHKLDAAGTRVYVAGARKSVRRNLLVAGLRRPRVRYASTVADATAHWRAISGEG
jgi:sulfate permease, SulP family